MWQGEDGLAPGARLVNQGIGAADGGLVLPADLYDLFRQAYRPGDPASVPSSHDGADEARYDSTTDARTHNNSYGSSLPVDIGDAASADQFVWDHEDMFIVASAGNDGPDPMTLGSPSIGRNVVSSGASAGGRQPGASIDSMAVFSSHGPDNAGAYGVDLVTPGQIVVGPKGGTDRDVQVLQGTSMSGPVLTGIATLTRQYFFDGYGPTASAGAHAAGFADGKGSGTGSGTNPSAALVRATLVNGAHRMRGFYTGDDGTDRAQDGRYPSAGQGFGQVNLRDSLSFDDAQGKSRQSAYFVDVWRDDADAFTLSSPCSTRTARCRSTSSLASPCRPRSPSPTRRPASPPAPPSP